MASGSEWDEVRRTAQRLEAQVEAKLSQFEERSNASTKGGGGGDLESASLLLDDELDALETGTDSLLRELGRINDKMGRCIEEGGGQRHRLQRHTDVLQDLSQRFRRMTQSHREQRDRADLLGSVKRDIQDYKDVGGAEAAMRERRAVENSLKGIDATIGQAQATQAELQRQRDSLGGIGGRLLGAAHQIPMLGMLVAKIQSKKSRNSNVLGITIGVCVSFLLFYAMT